MTGVGSFIVNLAGNYLISRVMARDGPRLENLEAAEGDYGVAMPRAYGEAVRLTGIFIAQDDILETKHKVEDYSEIVGAVGGAVQGFMIGGPVGAAIGAVVGGLLGFAAPDQKYYTYSCTFSLLLADRLGDEPIEGIGKAWANGKLIFSGAEAVTAQALDGDGKLLWRKYAKNRWFKSLTIYGGHADQPLDGVLAAAVQEVSGYPYVAHLVFEDLQLAAFGNSVPPCEALTAVETGASLAAVVERICASADIDVARDISTVSLIDRTVRGYVVTGESTCFDALKPLLPAFGVDCAEVAGQLRFYRRSQSIRATIDAQDMGGHAGGESPPERMKFTRATDLDLPQETSLTFIDPARDHQPNTATSTRSEGSAKSNITTSIPLVLSADEGASAAALLHWDAWLGRTEVGFTVTDAWWGLEPGLAYAIFYADRYVPYRITRRLRGANGLIEVEAVSDESVTYTASEAGTSGTMPPEEPTEFADTRLILMDMPILEDAHDDYGFYLVQAGAADYWERARVQAGSDGVTFATLFDRPLSAIVGDVTGTLAAGTTTGLDDTLDTTSVLTVVLLHDGMTLSSATDAELDAFRNFAFVGKDGLGEYLQFKTAAYVSGTTWQLTNLRRGRKGTDHAIGTHAGAEEFALLGGEGVFRIVSADTTAWGDTLHFRGVTLHQDEADAAIETFVNTGEGKRPYSPVNVSGSWDGSNNLTGTFDSRSRLNAGGLGVDDNAEWEVEITNATPDRLITVTAETFAYSAADMTSDGITPGDNVVGRVRQTSDVNDGRWRNFTLVGPNNALELEDDVTFLELEDDTTTIELG